MLVLVQFKLVSFMFIYYQLFKLMFIYDFFMYIHILDLIASMILVYMYIFMLRLLDGFVHGS